MGALATSGRHLVAWSAWGLAADGRIIVLGNVAGDAVAGFAARSTALYKQAVANMTPTSGGPPGLAGLSLLQNAVDG